jgi:hypothetical protein
MLEFDIEIIGEWQEDELLLKYVAENGLKKWSIFSLTLKDRIGKQCHERY